MNRTIEVLKIAIEREYQKENVDVEKVEELEAGKHYLEKSAIFMAAWQIELYAEEANRLCNKTSGLIEAMMRPLTTNFSIDDDNDINHIGH